MFLPRPAVKSCVLSLALNLAHCPYNSVQPVVPTERAITNNTSTRLDFHLKPPVDLARQRFKGVHNKPLLVAGGW